jgi:hypothetical protein
MGKQISDGLRRVSTGWVALAALLIFLLFTALVLPQQAIKSQQETGSADSPDTTFFYSPGDLYEIAKEYGEQGRRAYVQARFTFDLVWPLVYALFLATAISWVFSRAFAVGSLWQRANLAPLSAALFDYLENLSTSLVMLRYPDSTAVVDLLAPVFTAVKWGLLGLSLALLLGGIVVAVLHWIARTVRGVRTGAGGQEPGA